MGWMTVWQIGITILGALVVPVGLHLWKIRQNDLKHLEAAIQRVEGKLDTFIVEHLRDHAQRRD